MVGTDCRTTKTWLSGPGIWTLVALTVVIAVAFTPRLQAQILNPDNGHYYELATGSLLEWSDARAAAAAMTFMGVQGHLVTITSAEEQAFLFANFSQDFADRTWLGGTDEASEGNWTWLTGEPWVYENWASGEPNGSTDENCLIFFDASLEWHDDDCTDGHDFYVVEYDTQPVTALPSWALLGLCALLVLGSVWVLRRTLAV